MNIMNKKRISVLISVIIALSMLFVCMTTVVAVAVDESAQSGELYAEEITMGYDDGNNHTYRVYFTPDQKFTSFSMELEFPSFVRLEAVTPNYSLGNENGGQMAGSISGGTGVYTFETKDNVLSIALSNTVEITEQTRLFSVEIYAKEDLTQTGDVFVRECTIIDSDENELAVSFNLGSITVNQKEKLGMMGDMDSDNDVDLVDLVTVQRSITALSGNYELTELQRELADINGDDIVDIVDCQLIREYIAGILESLENYGGTNTPVEPEKPDDNEPTEYAMSVWYIGENGQFEFSGEYYVSEGQSVVDTLTQIASGYNAEVQGFYYDSSFTEQIPSSYLADKDMEVWVMLAPTQPQTYEVRFIIDGEYGLATTSTMMAGDHILYYIYDNILPEEEIDSVYYDRERTMEVLGADVVDQDIDVYIFSKEITEEPEEFYNVYVYANNENGWEIVESFPLEEGAYIYSAIEKYMGDAALVYINGVYYDEQMTSPIGRNDTISGDVYAYVYTDMGSDTYYTLSLYGSTKDGGFDFIGDFRESANANIYEIIMKRYSEYSINGIYYDIDLKDPVQYMDCVTRNMTLYIVFANVGGGESKESMLYVDIKDSDNEYLGYVQIPIAEGNYILDAIRNEFNVDSIDALYNQGGPEEWTAVGDTDVFTQDGCCAIIVYANRLAMYGYQKNGEGLTQIGDWTGYCFDGEYLYERVQRLLSEYNTPYSLVGIYTDESMTVEVEREATVSGDVIVYLELSDGNSNERQVQYSATAVQMMDGYPLYVANINDYAASGDLIIETIEEAVLKRAGLLYNVVGYYWDTMCTQPVSKEDVFELKINEYQGIESARIYVLFETKDVSGEYTVFEMNEETNEVVNFGTLTLNKDGTAILLIGMQTPEIELTEVVDENVEEQEPLTGEWYIAQGMLFVNIGDYSQYILALMDERTAVLGMAFVGDNRQEDAKCKAIAGDYTYVLTDIMEGEEVEMTFSFTLYANGVYAGNVMGMKLRGEYEVIVEGRFISIDMMGNKQYFNIDTQNKTMVENDIARFIGTTELYSDDKELLGSVTINYDGSATAPVDGVPKEGTIKYESGYLYFYYGEYDVLVIDYNVNDEGELINFRLEYSFQGSDYEENSAFDAYVGEYELQMHGDTLNTIEFMSNGTFYMYGDKFMTVLGRYEITDTGLKIYYFDSEDWAQEIVYDETTERYILKDLMMNQNGGTVTTNPEYKYE